MRNRSLICWSLEALSILALAPCAGAQAVASEHASEDVSLGLLDDPQLEVLSAEETATPGYSGHLAVGGRYAFDTDISDAGSFSQTTGFVDGGLGIPLGDGLKWNGVALYKYANYNFQDAPAFGGGSPWESINTVRLATTLAYQFDPAWSVYGGAFAVYAGEPGVDISDATTGGGVVGATYRPDEKLFLSFGVSVSSELEDNPTAFPLLAISWEMTERWTLRTATLDAGSVGGVGLDITYSLSPHWSVAGGATYLKNRFRLNDEGFAPDGVGQDDRTAIFARVTWQGSEGLVVSLLSGVDVGGQITVENANGDDLFKEHYDPQPFVGLNLTWRR